MYFNVNVVESPRYYSAILVAIDSCFQCQGVAGYLYYLAIVIAEYR